MWFIENERSECLIWFGSGISGLVLPFDFAHLRLRLMRKLRNRNLIMWNLRVCWRLIGYCVYGFISWVDLWYGLVSFFLFSWIWWRLNFLKDQTMQSGDRKKENRLKFENYQVGFLRRWRFERNEKNLRNLRSFEVAKVVGFSTKMWLEAEKMTENENPRETLKRLRVGFFYFFILCEGLGWIWVYCFWVKWVSMGFS